MNSKANIALTGASGFLGRFLMESMESQGIDFRGFVRDEAQASKDKSLHFLSDISKISREHFKGIDVVVHAAALAHVAGDSYEQTIANYRAVNVDGSKKLLAAAVEAGIRRVVYISSIKACAELSKPGKPLSALEECNPVDPYGVSKREAEEVIIECATNGDFELIILRPTLVYGVGAKGNLKLLMDALSKNRILPLGSISENRRSMLSVENVSDAIIRAATHPFPKANISNSGLPENVRIYHLADAETISTRHLVELMAQGMGMSPRFLSIPRFLALTAAFPFGKQAAVRRLFDSLEVTTDEFNSDFGWHPKVSIRDGIIEMAREWKRLGGW